MKDRIAEYLAKLERRNFTGSIRLSFEAGVLVAASEANRHDFPVTPADGGRDIVSWLLAMAGDPAFYGALVFVFRQGSIESYSYSRSYRGEKLLGLLLEG